MWQLFKYLRTEAGLDDNLLFSILPPAFHLFSFFFILPFFPLHLPPKPLIIFSADPLPKNYFFSFWKMKHTILWVDVIKPLPSAKRKWNQIKGHSNLENNNSSLKNKNKKPVVIPFRVTWKCLLSFLSECHDAILLIISWNWQRGILIKKIENLGLWKYQLMFFKWLKDWNPLNVVSQCSNILYRTLRTANVIPNLWHDNKFHSFHQSIFSVIPTQYLNPCVLPLNICRMDHQEKNSSWVAKEIFRG